jgi:transcriptional regulator with XRE-family HTH domain
MPMSNSPNSLKELDMSLDDWINARKMSSQQFGDLVGLTQGYVSRLRRGKVTPSIITAITIRNQTNGEVTVDDLDPRKVRAEISQDDNG